jgi:excisionase family DNA binding protein
MTANVASGGRPAALLTRAQVMLEVPRLLTPAQVAERLAVSRSAIYAWVRAGHLPAIYVGRLPRFAEADVLEFIASRRRTPQVSP